MNLLEYQNSEFKVRSVIREGDPWFVAKDICDLLGLTNSRKATEDLHEDERSSVTISDGTDGNPNHTIINESGLYALIFRSRKPEAQAFRRWVTGEVLPAIRREGQYRIRALDMVRIKELEKDLEVSRLSVRKQRDYIKLVGALPGHIPIAEWADSCGCEISGRDRIRIGASLAASARAELVSRGYCYRKVFKHGRMMGSERKSTFLPEVIEERARELLIFRAAELATR